MVRQGSNNLYSVAWSGQGRWASAGIQPWQDIDLKKRGQGFNLHAALHIFDWGRMTIVK